MAGEDPARVQEDRDDPWLKHPFGRTFDLISSEYGWTDEQILDLTLTRMRFTRDLILERLAERKDWEIDLAEQVTKQIVLHVRLASQERGSSAAKAANRVKLFQRAKKRELPSTEKILSQVGGSTEDLIDPNLISAAYGARAA